MSIASKIKYFKIESSCRSKICLPVISTLMILNFTIVNATDKNNFKKSQISLGTNLWDISWPNANPWKEKPEDAIDPKKTGATDYNPWNEQFLNELKIYSCIRFMDAGRINNQNPEFGNVRTWNGNPEKSWADRNPETNPNQSQMSVYWMVDLCNRLNADMWLCVPELADSSWWAGAAGLIHAKLKPTLKIYVEYSNEVWNNGFTAYHTALSRGADLNLWFRNDDKTKSYAKDRCAARYQTYISTQIWKKFVTEFGVDQKRVIKVLSGQTSNDWLNATLLHAVTDSTINKTGLQPDFFSIASYFGQEIKKGDKDKLKLLKKDIPELQKKIIRTENVINGTCNEKWYEQTPCKLSNMKLICYEGGQHLLAGADSVSANPEIYRIYRDYLKVIEKHFQGVYCHYVHCGVWENNGAWGAKAFIGQDEKFAHKYRALKYWRNKFK